MLKDVPISEDVITQVVVESQTEQPDETFNVSPQLKYADQINSLIENLNKIQNIAVQNLPTIIGCTITGNDDTEILLETARYYIISDSEGILKEGFSTSVKVDENIATCHRKACTRALSKFHETESDWGTVWKINKPKQWSYGQWTIDVLLSNMVQKGLSPTQAVDYWMVEIQGKHIPNWAKKRGTSSQAIRDSVEKAKSQIEQSNKGFDYSSTDYFNRTYRGIRTSKGNAIVEVDGGYLYPRRDLHRFTSTGSFSWGSGGSGPKQLAVAILADALQANDIPSYLATAFTGYLNRTIGDEDEWEITKDEVISWVDKYEDDVDQSEGSMR